MAALTFGVLTVSDTCYAGVKEDTAGPKLCKYIKECLPTAEIILQSVVHDEKKSIQDVLLSWVSLNCNVILTVGGTGFSPRDVTPEATRAIIDKEAPAIITAITLGSLKITPMAMLSRAVCGIKKKSIIINLPGSAKGAVECFGFVKDVIKHAADLVLENDRCVHKTHEAVQSAEGSKVKINCAAQRSRNSPYPLVAVSAAQLAVNNCFNNSDDIEEIDIQNSLNRVLAADVYSKDPLPPFPASIKDGYAVIAADGAGIRSVREAVAAGDNPSLMPLRSGEVVRISTGAPVPDGADAVVQVEDTDLIEHSVDYSKEIKIEIKITPTPGLDIRPMGSDIPSNSKMIHRNERITPAHIGVLAAIGQTKIRVYRQLAVGVLSTGNELQSPHETLKPGHIRDSNKLTLINLFKQYGYRADDCGIAGDKPDDVKRALIAALSLHDVVVSTGGVSMGEFDVVKNVLITDFGADVHFGRVNMKPGKPTTFATCKLNGKQKYIFGLPGNPVSASVTSILFVIPALQKYENQPRSDQRTKVILGEKVDLDPRPEYMRASIDSESESGRFIVRPSGNQISSRLNSFLGAPFLLVLPGKTPELKFLEAGTLVDAIRIN